jgi:hypothetical protein
MAGTLHFLRRGEDNLGGTVDRPSRSGALARMAENGTYLLRGVSPSVQRTAHARAVREVTTLRRVLLQGLHEYAAATWTPQAGVRVAESSPTASVATFVQICASGNGVFGLDEGGNVHQYNVTVKSWEPLVPSALGPGG